MFYNLNSHSIVKIYRDQYQLHFINGLDISLNLDELLCFLSFDGIDCQIIDTLNYIDKSKLDLFLDNNMIYLSESDRKLYNCDYKNNLKNIFDKDNKYDNKKINLSNISFIMFKNCNLDCSFCYLGKKDFIDISNIDLSVVDKLISEGLICGLNSVTLSGGEMGLLSDRKISELKNIFEKYISKINIKLISNGYNVDNLLTLPISEFVLSLDGLENTHDLFRGNGSFNKVIYAIEILKNHDKQIAINHIVNKQNLSELIDFLNFCKLKNISNIGLNNEFPFGNSNCNNILTPIDNQLVNYISTFFQDLNVYHYTQDKSDPVLYNCQNGFLSFYYYVPEKKQYFCSYNLVSDIGYVSDNLLELLNNNYIQSYILDDPVSLSCTACMVRSFCFRNCRMNKLVKSTCYKDCDDYKYIFRIIPVTTEFLRDNFGDWFSYLQDPKNDHLIAKNQMMVYATDKNDQMVAKILFKESEFPYIWRLGHMGVKNELKRKGFGSNLLRFVESHIKLNCGKKILVHVSEVNKVAQKFYESQGYVREATIQKMKLGIEPLHIYTKEIN